MIDTPTQIVSNMKKQSLNNNQIIQYLQREGYSPSQINEALQQSEMTSDYQRSTLSKRAQEPLPEIPTPEPIPTSESITQPQFSQPVFIPDYETPNRDLQEQIEIITESVISEKWKEFLKNIGNISTWKLNIESQITNLQKDSKKTQTEIENLKQAILNKIDQYQESISEVNAEMKALEKLFKELLPSIKKLK